MLKRSLLILPLLSAISSYSMADGLCDYKGDWNGVISTAVAGYIPGAIVDFTLYANTLSISEDGAITGSVLSSTTNKTMNISGRVDSHGHFILHSDGADHCQTSGHATLMQNNKVEFKGNGICNQRQENGSMKTVYNIMSSILKKVGPN